MITRPVTTRKLTSSGVHCRQKIERSSRLLASVERIDPGSPTFVENDGPPHASAGGIAPLSTLSASGTGLAARNRRMRSLASLPRAKNVL